MKDDTIITNAVVFRYDTGTGGVNYKSGALYVSGGKLIFVGNAGPETITST